MYLSYFGGLLIDLLNQLLHGYLPILQIIEFKVKLIALPTLHDFVDPQQIHQMVDVDPVEAVGLVHGLGGF